MEMCSLIMRLLKPNEVLLTSTVATENSHLVSGKQKNFSYFTELQIISMWALLLAPKHPFSVSFEPQPSFNS